MSSKKKTPKNLVDIDGILCAGLFTGLEDSGDPVMLDFAGPENYRNLCVDAARCLARAPNEDGVRVILDEIVVYVLPGPGDRAVSAIMTKGHPVLKSSKRLMRSALRA